VAYRAEIEIGVKGQRELERLRSLITQTTTAFESLNKIAAARGGLNQTLVNYETQLTRAKRAIDNVTAGTQAEVKAIREYVTAMGLANAARDRQNYLIAQEVANRRRVQATINAGFGQQGPALPPSMRNAGFGQQGPGLPPRVSTRRAGGVGGGNVGGIVSNAIIGGAFPLLFGQGGGAATGGAIGGAVGGLFGGAGGFAGSLLGTLLGQIAGQANQVKELAADIGFSAQQTQLLATAFKQAGADFDKFQASVSRIGGLSLSLEDQAKAIQLASNLTEIYKGKIDKVTDAFTNALQNGKVSQATLNQLTSQNIPIQQALADKYGVTRTKILEMAKDGKISVQDLIDTLVDLGNKGTNSVNKTTSTFDKLKTAVNNLGTAFANLGTTIVSALQPVLDWLGLRIADLINIASNAISEVAKLVETVSRGPQAATRAALKRGELPFGTQGVGEIIGQPRLQKIIKQAGPGTLGVGVNEKKVIELLLKEPEFADVKPPTKLKLTPFKAPSQLLPSGRNAGRTNNTDAAREAERVAKVLRDTKAETELLTVQAAIKDRIFQAEQAKDSLLAARLQGEENILNIQARYAEILANEPNIRAQEAIVAKGLQEIENARLNTAQNLEKIESARTEKFQDIIINLERQNELDTIKDERARALREIEFQILDYKKQGLIVSETEAQIYRDLAQSRVKTTGQKRIEELQTSISALTNAENQAVATAENISQAFGNSFKGIISGSMTAQEALAGFFQSVADRFLDMAAQIIAKWIEMTILNSILNLFPGGGGGGGGGFGSLQANLQQYAPLPGFAAGGRPPVGKPSIVGERGPELFVPSSSGVIVPNHMLGGMGGDVSVVVNVDASGSNVQGNESQAKALGGAISAAVQAEIVKQQRPGGLLAGTR